MSHVTETVACPRCGGGLGADGPAEAAGPGLPALHCLVCAQGFPAPGGIPWLFADPQAAQIGWRNRFQFAMARLASEAATAAAAAASARNGAASRRLRQLCAGSEAQSRAIAELLEPVLGQGSGPLESHVALRTALPSAQGLFTYETNLFRDWCWGGDETAASLSAIGAALAGRSPERILVLGSGAGRLAYDLHQNSTATLTVALDINPLLAHVGGRVAAGGSLQLTEFPLAPREPEDVAVLRELKAPAPARPGLVYLLGDLWQPPFGAGVFDLVVTPWVLDILDRPIGGLLARINRLLAAEGVWINHGSNAFALADPAERLSLEELLDAARVSGFAVDFCASREMPYLRCPASRHSRLEEVITFSAVRTGAAHNVADGMPAPRWLTDPEQPIPALPAFQTQALATRTHAYILSLIDGRRSIADVAQVLDQHGLIEAADGQVALQGFFTTLHDEAIRGG